MKTPLARQKSWTRAGQELDKDLFWGLKKIGASTSLMHIPLLPELKYKFIRSLYDKARVKEAFREREAEKKALATHWNNLINMQYGGHGHYAYDDEHYDYNGGDAAEFPELLEVTTAINTNNKIERFPDGKMTCFQCHAQTSDLCYQTGKEQLCAGADPGDY